MHTHADLDDRPSSAVERAARRLATSSAGGSPARESSARPLVVVGGFKHELKASPSERRRSRTSGAGYYAEGADIFARAEKQAPGARRHTGDRRAGGHRPRPTVHMHALFAGGPIDHAIYERARSLIVGAVTEHRERLTGIMLPLHGATVTTEEDDPEGDLLATLRDLVGPDILAQRREEVALQVVFPRS